MSVNRTRNTLCVRCKRRFATRFSLLCTNCMAECRAEIAERESTAAHETGHTAPPRLAEWQEAAK